MDEGEIVLYQPDEIIKLEVHLKMRPSGYLLKRCLNFLDETSV